MQLPEKLIKNFDSFVLMTQKDFLARRTNSFDNNLPLIIYGITDFAAVRAKLKQYFGNPEVQYDDAYITVLPRPFMERAVYSFGDLVEIIKRLRDKDGCPWDKKQTNMSIRSNAVEEAYELAEAVELDDSDKMLEESGDVLLQGLFNAVIAEDDGRFTTAEMLSALCKKLVFRHTHIFGSDKAGNSEEALKFWEQAKAVEKGQTALRDKIAAVPRTFGSVMRAEKVQKLIKKTGFDFPSADEAYAKVFEEIQELREAESHAHIESEGGDLLFSVVNLLRMLDIDSELALNGTTNRFIKRFLYVERRAQFVGKKLEDCTLDEMEKWYQEAKSFETPVL
ncbi:MAG: nucleoside triphosphate pyrophosphohydrolase [Clostridia bacterium]|nr:nucleoside triphosphate pyrophosphohydrolase [Clostridia bacterium]